MVGARWAGAAAVGGIRARGGCFVVWKLWCDLAVATGDVRVTVCAVAIASPRQHPELRLRRLPPRDGRVLQWNFKLCGSHVCRHAEMDRLTWKRKLVDGGDADFQRAVVLVAVLGDWLP